MPDESTTPTADTPQERDAKAKVLATSLDAREKRYIETARLVAKEMRYLRIEQRVFYGVTLTAFTVAIALVA